MCNMMLTEESLKVMDAMTNVCSLSSPLPLLSFFSHTYNSNSHPQDIHALERDAVEGQRDNAQISMSKVSVYFCQLCLFDSTKEKAFWYLGDVQQEVCTTYIYSSIIDCQPKITFNPIIQVKQLSISFVT